MGSKDYDLSEWYNECPNPNDIPDSIKYIKKIIRGHKQISVYTGELSKDKYDAFSEIWSVVAEPFGYSRFIVKEKKKK